MCSPTDLPQVVTHVTHNSVESMEPDPALWAEMPDAARAALVRLVSDGLERLSRHPEDWLPRQLVARPGNGLGIFLLWTFDQIDVALAAERADVLRQEQDHVVALTQLIGTD